jgi:Arc/MetJ-type ribon-helix-helix transcriptional regulator
MVLMSIHIPKQMLDEINDLVASGKYTSVSEFIRYAIRDLLNNLRGLANQVATTTNPQPQAQAQQHVHMVLDAAVLGMDVKPAANEPSNGAVEYVIEKLIAWAEAERKSEEAKRYRECVAKLVDAILNNLNHLMFNIKQEDGTYKISKKVVREFLEVDCGLSKGMVAASYGAMAKEFDKRGFIMMRTPTAIILKKKQKQEVVRNVQ